MLSYEHKFHQKKLNNSIRSRCDDLTYLTEKLVIISVNEFHSTLWIQKPCRQAFYRNVQPSLAYYNAIMFTHRCTTKQSRKGYVNLVDSHIYACMVLQSIYNSKCFKQLCLLAQFEEKKISVCWDKEVVYTFNKKKCLQRR